MSKPLTKAEQDAADRRKMEELLRQRAAANPAPVTNHRLRVPKNYNEEPRGKPNPDYSKQYQEDLKKGLRARGGYAYADGGFIEQAKELYDVAQNYPEEFERAYTGFKGEINKIYDFWKDVLGFKRGGHVGFKR